jgi:hypothetical protein
MKKWKATCLILAITISTTGLFVAFGEDIQSRLADWGHNLGEGMKIIYEESHSPENLNVVAYINDIPVYEHEIIERILINKVILDSMKAAGSSSSLSWGSNPFDYVYREKFELNYAEINGIEVSKEELEKYISVEKSSWESEDTKEIFAKYLDGLGLTKEQFYNEFAPPLYKEKLIKDKVREDILKNAGMIEKNNEAKQKYLDDFFKENIKVKEIDKDFIDKHSESTGF